ncbi:MAG: hypothetical protein WD042_09105 [Phycisphaeraceae bacterium]
MHPPRDFHWSDVPPDWPFDQAPNVAAITTARVIEDGYPILCAVHYDDDDSWAIVCGTTNETSDGRVISMKTALLMDPTLREIADLPPGYSAFRPAVGAEWVRHEDA